MAWGGGSAWMAGRRREAAPGWAGGGGTRQGGERRGGRAVPAGEVAAWGRPAPAPAQGGSGVGREGQRWGTEETADPFCVGSVLIKVTTARGRNGRSPLLFFPRPKTTTNVFQRVAYVS